VEAPNETGVASGAVTGLAQNAPAALELCGFRAARALHIASVMNPYGRAALVGVALGSCVVRPPATPAPDTCGTPPTDVIASRQTVRFNVTGSAGSYVVTSGWLCGPLGVVSVAADGSTTDVLLGLPYQCICECAPPPAETVTWASPLGGASPATVVWDARALATYVECIDCVARGYPGEGIQMMTAGSLQPVAAGHFRATFAILDTVPSNCTVQADGALDCPPVTTSFPQIPWPTEYGLCPASRTVSVGFDLPATGDLDVEVTVP
jgi:hypothetical protein